jgi:atypical dual specificity phosphatase
MTLKAALGQIIRVRPQISPNAGFLQQLKEMEMELYGSSSLEVAEFPKREKDRLALFEEPKEQQKKQPEVAVATETAS